MVDSHGSTDRNRPAHTKARWCEQWPKIFITSGPDENIWRNIRPGWTRQSVNSFLDRNLAVRRSLFWSNNSFNLYSLLIESGFQWTERYASGPRVPGRPRGPIITNNANLGKNTDNGFANVWSEFDLYLNHQSLDYSTFVHESLYHGNTSYMRARWGRELWSLYEFTVSVEVSSSYRILSPINSLKRMIINS